MELEKKIFSIYLLFFSLLKPCPSLSIPSFYQDNHDEDDDRDYICSLEKDNGMHRCLHLPNYRYYHLTCSESALTLPNTNEPNETSCVDWNQYYTDCRPGQHNPFQDAVSFDNVGMAWIAIFLVISLEGWSDIMYYVQDAHSFWSWIYFVLLIVVSILCLRSFLICLPDLFDVRS